MNNFARSLKIALEYRFTLAASIASALVVAVLWGGNIGTIYPIFEISLKGESLPAWAERNIAEQRQGLAEAEQELARVDAAERPNAAEHRVLISAREARAQKLAYYQWALDAVIRPYLNYGPFQTLVLAIGVLLAGSLVKSAFTVVNQIVVFRLAQLVVLRVRKQLFRQMLATDMARFAGEGTNELMSRFTYDMESLLSALQEVYGKLVREPLKVLACLVGAALISWRLLLLSLVLAPPTFYLIRLLAKALKRANRRVMEEMSEMYALLDEAMHGIKIVKAFTMERAERRRFHHSNKAFLRKSMRIGRYDSLTRPLTEVLGILMISIAFLAGAYLVLNQTTTLFGVKLAAEPPSLGSMILFFGMLAGMSDPARKLSEVFSRIQRGAAAADRIYELIDREPTIVSPPKPRPLRRHHVDLVFDHVRFHYRPGQAVLDDVTLRIPAGETVAIVGPNGCGKSTLANLLLRFYDPVAGRILLDGVDLRDLRLRDLRSQIGLVTQETLLFDDTVLSNIRYGSPGASRDAVIDAARRAHAHRFIEEKLEHGYDTVVGQRGGRLSGGQRQRIALARAMLRDPAILVLDEATSQVDLESEQVIHTVLEEFVRNRTTIIITHRLSTLALADRIVVMNAGRVLDVGTHDELLDRCDLYGRLHDLQFRESA
jgi:ATP-binding cassette subfamily B protein/subfamily B ATP-binding cassette protein MsbA